MIYDHSQLPRTASLASLVVEHTSGTQPTAYLPTIGCIHIIMMVPPNYRYPTYHYDDTSQL